MSASEHLQNGTAGGTADRDPEAVINEIKIPQCNPVACIFLEQQPPARSMIGECTIGLPGFDLMEGCGFVPM